jgi:hypothetical protein
MTAWRKLANDRKMLGKLTKTVQDLKQRGLLQYDEHTLRYDLHPVVRGVASGGMRAEDKNIHGQRVVDYFSSVPHNPYEQAKTLEDVEPGLHVVRTLLKLNRFQEAVNAYGGDLANALSFNLESLAETLALLRPFFPDGWEKLPETVGKTDAVYLATDAAIALAKSGNTNLALAACEGALRVDLEQKNWRGVQARITNISNSLSDQNARAKTDNIRNLVAELAVATNDNDYLFVTRLLLFANQAQLGQWEAAEKTWGVLDAMERPQNRNVHRPGDAECCFAQVRFWQGALREEDLDVARELAEKGENRGAIRSLHCLRGEWHLERGEWDLAATSFAEAVRMARERRLQDMGSESGLVLAKIYQGQLDPAQARREAERLAGLRKPADRELALLWRKIGDLEQAKQYALAAYQWAWADGEPYVNRYELDKSKELLCELGVPIPELPPYDPAKHAPFPWEADVRAGIAELNAAKAAREKSGE